MRHTILRFNSFSSKLISIRFPFLAVVALFISFAASQQASAATYLVTTNAYDSDGTTTSCNPGSGGLCSLRQAINAANYTAGDDTITFASGLASQTITLSPQIGTILINTNMVIDATNVGGIQVSGGNAVSVFTIYSNANITMRGFTIRNGNGGSGGGGISASSGDLNLDRMIIRNNTADYGGGIKSSFGILTVTNSTVTENNGGGIVAGNVTLNNVVLTNNHSNTPDYNLAGGGMSGRNATIINCTIAGNSVSSSGSGFNHGGGGVYFDGGTNFVSGTTFSGNSATGGDGNGGGIAVYSSGTTTTLTVINSTISGNAAYNGGGIFNDYNASTTLKNVTIAGNTATNSGGGIYHSEPPENFRFGVSKGFGIETLDLTNTIVADNTAPNNPDVDGSINSLGNNIVRNRGTSTGYDVTDLPDGTNPRLAPLGYYGGVPLTYALSNNSPAINSGNNSNATATDQRGVAREGNTDIGSFEVNTAYVAVLPSATKGLNYNYMLVPDKGTFTYSLAPGSNPLPSGLILDTNAAAVVLTGIPTIAGTYDFTIRATNTNGDSSDINYRIIVVGSNAGAFTVNTNLDNESNGCAIGNCTLREAVTDANANGEADTITFDPTFFNTARTINLSGSQLTIDADGGNPLTINGTGANQLTISGVNQYRVFRINAGANANINNLTATRGSISKNYGGGIYNAGTLTLTNVIVSNSTALSGFGGGINNAGTLTLANSVVSGSEASGGGGGIYSYGALVVTNSIISGNTSRNFSTAGGTAGRSFGGGIASYDTVTITNSTVGGNTATSTISGTDSVGGGIYIKGNANITNSTFSGNRAIGAGSGDGCGGGVGNDGILSLTNSTISNNTALDTGAGMQQGNEVAGSYSILTNVTITNNNSPNFAGGIRNFSQIKLRNTIVAGNSAAIDPDVRNNGFPAFTSLGNNLIGNVGTASGFTDGANGDIVGSSGSPVLARLAPLGNYGGATYTHPLLSNSPAINAGNNCVVDLSCSSDNPPFAVMTDQRGANRQDNVDIGAFEVNTAYVAVLPPGIVQQNYNQTIVPDSGSFTYTVVNGSLPPGLTLTTSVAFAKTADDKGANNFSPSAVVAVSGTPTMGGTYNFTVRATNTNGNIVDTNYQIFVAASPTAASVTVGGRVLDNSGRGISRARVTLTDANGETRTALTNSFGYYRFDDVPAGQTYVFSVNHRRYQFVPQVLSVNEVIANLNFTALQ